jgi:predicted PurR-regulated permease PerM
LAAAADGYERQQRLFQNIVNAITAVVHGCLLVAVIQGLLAGLALALRRALRRLGSPHRLRRAAAVGGTTLV